MAMADFDNVADCCNNGSTNGVNFDFHIQKRGFQAMWFFKLQLVFADISDFCTHNPVLF